jgi:hypothetical protein
MTAPRKTQRSAGKDTKVGLGSTPAGGERWLSTVEQPVPRVPIGEEASRIAAECDDPALPVAVGTHPYAPSKIASGNSAETT